MEKSDILIRGGTVAHGTGTPLREADIALKNGRVVAVGKDLGQGRDEIDARGKLVTPGFVDIHTHYEGEATKALPGKLVRGAQAAPSVS